MVFKKFKTTKSQRFLMLLMLSIIIGLANAAIFYSLSISPTVSITDPAVLFVAGDDFPSGSAIGDNSSTVDLALTAYPNITLTYEEPLNVSNTDASDHQFRLRHIAISPDGTADVGNFSYICFTVLDQGGSQQAVFNYTTSGNSWVPPSTTSYMTLPTGTDWVLYIETKAAPSANDVTAYMTLAVDVQ